ncbi:zinc finger, CCHC-type containing protein [Tanacetum coccineum]
MDEAIQVSCIIDKLSPSWKDFKHTLKHQKEELTLVELGIHLRIKESLRVQDNDKPKGNNVAGPSTVNMRDHNNSFSDLLEVWETGHLKKDCKGGKVDNKANGSDINDSMDGSTNLLKGATVHVCKDRCSFKTYESLNDGSILHMRNESTTLDETLDKFKVFKTEVELQQGSLIKRFRTDRGGEYMDTMYFQSVGIIHEPTTPYTLQQNGISERKNRVLKEMVNSMLSYLGLSQGFWGEAMLTACCRAVVRLPDPNLKTLGERGIECIFIGYAEHSKAFRFYVIEPNDSVSINSIIESRDAIFDENIFSLVPRPSLRILNGTEDIGGSVVPKEVTKEVVQQPKLELRKSKRNRTPKDFGPEFQLYLIEGARDEVFDQHSYFFNVDNNPKTFDEAMKSQDVAFWKEAINDEMDSIMGNNTWVLADLPPGCKPLGCKWIFKRKLKYHKTADCWLYCVDWLRGTGARVSTVVDVYVRESMRRSLGIDRAPKQWYQKFDGVVLSNGYLLNQADKCVYNKFDETGKGVIICLYVDDMLIFGTDQVRVDLTQEFLSSRFSMKGMEEADVILVIRIKHESNRIAISQSHYIEKVLKKFNYFDCTLVRSPMDTSEKLMSNSGQVVSQLEYSRVISCPMYAMTSVLKYLKKTMDYSLIYTGFLLVLEGYIDASKKQTCITSSIMEYEFVALVAAGKEAEWLRNLVLEIPLWSKPIAHISILCDSAATLAKAYSQMYNGKSIHLGLRKKYRISLKNDMSPQDNGTNGEDAVEHIEYFLRIIDPIDLPNVNQDKLRVLVFPISLVGDAWKCSNEHGFCNGGELRGMVLVGYMRYFQDHEWYNDLMDGSLKDEALEQKAIYEESWGDAKQRHRCKEIDKVGKVSIIWNLMCDCSHAGIEMHLQHTSLLMNSAWRIYQAKNQRSFSF